MSFQTASQSLFVKRNDDSYDSARYKLVADRLSDLGLSQTYLTLIDQENPSGNLPYHGNQHLYAVANLCYAGAIMHQDSGAYLRECFLAGLFHDYDYTVGQSEDENISRAVLKAEKIVGALDNHLTAKVIELIQASRFPHNEPKDTAEKVIQDSDLLMISQPDSNRFLTGLAQETGSSLRQDFPGSQSLHTEWARNIYASALNVRASAHSFLNTNEALDIGLTRHIQALSSRGFLVDESLLLCLEAIWSAGFETAYSCGGSPEGLKLDDYRVTSDGYIAFINTTPQQNEKLKKAAKTIGQQLSDFQSINGLKMKIIRFSWSQKDTMIQSLLNR